MSLPAVQEPADKQAIGTRRLTLNEAKAELLRALFPVAARGLVPVANAAGRIFANDLVAPLDLPPQNRAALDGYAYRSSDLAGATVRLRLVGQSAAGHPFTGKVEAGSAIRILTGGTVPDDCDRVIMQEVCRESAGYVSFPTADAVDRHIRDRGEDYRADGLILPRGHRLRAVDLGVAAACGLPVLPVYEPLRVALFSTGDELVEPGLTLPPGHIWDANRAMLKTMISETGATVSDFRILTDHLADMMDALTKAAHDHDLIVTSGGMSVGDEDHVKQVIHRRGHLEIWRLAIKPGKPVGFGDIDDCPIIALPGNPVAAVATFLTLGRPAMSRLSGRTDQAARELHLPTTRALSKSAGRREFLLAKLDQWDGVSAVTPVSKRGSAMLSALVEADGLIDLDEAATEITPGQPVRFLPLRQSLD